MIKIESKIENDEKSIIHRYIEGDKGAFENLIESYQESAIRFAYRYLKDEHLSEDIAQEAFAYVYVNREKFNRKYSFKTYLFTIIKNKSIDYIRKNNRIIYSNDIASKEYQHMEEHETVLSAEAEYINKIQSMELRNCMDELKPDYRTALYLYEFEGISYKEIAKIMGKTTAQIKIILYRSRKKLGQVYKELIEGTEN